MRISVDDPIIRVLRKIQTNGHPEAIIAGGAARDLFLNRLIKDFDIFVTRSRAAGMDYWANLLQLTKASYPIQGFITDPQTLAFFSHDNLLLRSHQSNNPHMDGAYRRSYITDVFDMILDRVVYQIVVLRADPVEYVRDYFDFGICKAWCDGTRFRYSGPFMRDVHDRTLTLCPTTVTDGEMDYCLTHRKPKLRQYFPGYTFVVAPHLQDQYNQSINRLRARGIRC